MRVTRGSSRVTSLFAVDVELVDVHRAEFEDLDEFVVEAVALLLEEDRASGVELDRDRGREQERRQHQQAQGSHDLVEDQLENDVPIGERLVEHVEHRRRADIGIGSRPQAQAIGVRGEAHVDRQHPEFAKHLQYALLRADRQRENREIDARRPGRTPRDRRRCRVWENLRQSSGARSSPRSSNTPSRRTSAGSALARSFNNRDAYSPPPTTTARRSSLPFRARAETRRAKNSLSTATEKNPSKNHDTIQKRDNARVGFRKNTRAKISRNDPPHPPASRDRRRIGNRNVGTE